MSNYTAQEQRNIDTLNSLFEGPPELDRMALFSEDAVWWNGLPRLPGAEGVTEHKGLEAIGRIMAGAGQPRKGTDSYDLSTNRFSDIVVLADGDFVMRQHTQHSKTLAGKDYVNVYCFVVRFNAEGKIAYLTEHWNTWHAARVLIDTWDIEPAHPIK